MKTKIKALIEKWEEELTKLEARKGDAVIDDCIKIGRGAQLEEDIKDLKYLQNQTDYEIIKGAFDQTGIGYIVNTDFPLGSPKTITLYVVNKEPLHICFTKSGKFIEVI